jgi:hypothetical protein
MYACNSSNIPLPCVACLSLLMQCRDLVRGLAPAAVEWLRVNADPQTICGSIDVCGATPHMPSLLKV